MCSALTGTQTCPGEQVSPSKEGRRTLPVPDPIGDQAPWRGSLPTLSVLSRPSGAADPSPWAEAGQTGPLLPFLRLNPLGY